MIIPEPKSLHAALSPILYFNWIIGMGSSPPARSRLVQIMMILYTVGLWIFYIIAFRTGISVMVSLYSDEISPMAIIMYQVLVYTNTCMSVISPVLAWLRRNGLRDCIERIQKLDDSAAIILGFTKNYKKIVIQQIYHILMIFFVMLAITITDSLWIQRQTSILTNFAVMITFHQPILITLVTDLNFCGSMRSLNQRFQEVNIALLGLTEPDIAPYPRGRLIIVQHTITKSSSFNGGNDGAAKDSINKRYLFHTIRTTHLELSKLAEKLNSVFGIQNLISMAVSSVMITGLLYTIYSALYWKNSVHETVKEVMPPACWCIIFVFKIFMISHHCATVSSEAQKSGQIIYEVLGSAVDKEFQKQIQEFALQMIQNPVRFTACGFFTLDYTYIQGVIGSITTYLVIIIQMSNTTSSTSTATTNRTATLTVQPN